MRHLSKDNQTESLTIWNSEEDKELYGYAMRILGQWALNTFAVLMIAVALKMVMECLLMLGSFLVIRKFAGGYHSESFAVCFLSSVLILTGGLMVIRYGCLIPLPVFILFDTIAVALLSAFAPVENSNKPLTEIEKRRFHIVTIFLLSILIIIGLFALVFWNNEKSFFSISVGVTFAGALFLIGKIVY